MPTINDERIAVDHKSFDKGSPPDATLGVLKEEAKSLGINLEVANVASFAENDQTKPGTGIPELIKNTVHRPSTPASFWPARKPGSNDRAMMDYGRGERDG